ncbi:hypothetical protein SAY87_006043 [Trapa incisa]|uniref:Uncharacterized protein n=1 Tax=Trapa incisa TaxID=236973 RepID=A0AAN7QCN5_9MYRT|nr:hypothetical protein SAY87_006043 [Trapa incisa]
MAKCPGERDVEPKVDDLEIISIGSLYRGPLDKKYWSCSRGKDRYPYPVGYHAVRFHEGNMCKMEICEASNGPMFVITSADGHSCFGETPTIAWEKFQRKGVLRKRIMHRKTFSCKFDGVEFFGFKNTSVQRLLRELVADVNGNVEQSLLSPNYCNEASLTEQKDECLVLCPYPDLSEALARPLNPGKRTLKYGGRDKKFERAITSERPKDKIQTDVKITYSRRKRQKDSKNITVLPALEENADVKGTHETPTKPSSSSNISKAYEVPREVEEDLMLRAPVDEMDLLNSSRLKENVNEVAISVKVPAGIDDKDLFVNDSMDESQAHELSAAQGPTVDFLIESNPEEVDIGHSGGNAEKSMYDSACPEMATSMMTVLLPQALPLLEKFSKEKNKRNGKALVKDDTLNHRKMLENDVIDQTVNALSPVADATISRHGQVNLEDVSALDDFCYATGYLNHIATNPAPEISRNQEYVHQENNWDSLKDKDASVMTNFACYGREYPSNAKLMEDDLKPSVHFLAQNFHCDKLNLEQSDDENASMARSCGQQCKGQGPSIASFNSEAKGINDARILTVKADVETRNSGNENSLHIATPASPTKKYEPPLSERMVLRNSGSSYLMETCPVDRNLIAHKASQDSCDEQSNNSRYDTDKPLLGDTPSISCRENLMAKGKVDLDAVSNVSEKHTSTHISSAKGTSGSEVLSISIKKSHQSEHTGLELKKDTFESNSYMLCQTSTIELSEYKSSVSDQDHEDSFYEISGDKIMQNELTGLFQLTGCYAHPLPILSLLLRHHSNEIYLCVQCGRSVDEVKILFLYKLLTEERGRGSPSYIGQTPFLAPISSPNTSRIMPERTCLQLTPDGQKLILLGNVKMPYCRERRISCHCPTCVSVSSDNNAVRIVQVNSGYSTVVVSLKMIDTILTMLVCEPNYIVATGESGRLHAWIMNPKWSGQIEEFDLLTNECVSPCIVDLKKVPDYASLVVGYNSHREFTLWDISRRTSLATFSALNTSVHHFFPISSLSWRWDSTTSKKYDMNEYINEIMGMTMKNPDECSGNHTSLQSEREEIAIWLLIAAVSNYEDGYRYNTSKEDAGDWWRLALLANNSIVLGSPLDSGGSVMAALSGFGVVGTRNGLVYLWELSTGNKIATLNHFKGNGVSCIATDDSASSILAIGGCNGDVVVYQRSNKGSSN